MFYPICFHKGSRRSIISLEGSSDGIPSPLLAQPLHFKGNRLLPYGLSYIDSVKSFWLAFTLQCQTQGRMFVTWVLRSSFIVVVVLAGAFASRASTDTKSAGNADAKQLRTDVRVPVSYLACHAICCSHVRISPSLRRQKMKKANLACILVVFAISSYLMLDIPTVDIWTHS